MDRVTKSQLAEAALEFLEREEELKALRLQISILTQRRNDAKDRYQDLKRGAIVQGDRELS